MNKYPFVGLLAFVIASSAFATPTDVNVLSWNIKRGIGSNSPNSGEQAYLAKTVNYLRPDIWTINELGGNGSGYSQATEKASLISFIGSRVTVFGNNPTEGKDYFVYVGSFSDGFIGNAIVSRYKLTDQTSYFDGLRGLIHANALLPNGSTLGIFTEHLKATTNSADSAADSVKRQTEAELSASNIANWKTGNPNTAAVLTGDFNLSEDPGENDNWTGGNIGDPLSNGHAYHPISTLKGAGFLDGVPVSANGDKDTISSGGSNPSNRFDYNLYSGTGGISYLGGQVFNSAAYPVGHYPSGFAFGDSGLASDHLAVLGQYRVDSVPEPSSFFLSGLGVVGLLVRRRSGSKCKAK